MPGTFVLSLDCEGKWGMADGLTADHHRWLTTANLRDAYRRLLDLFDRHDIPATFAFVMALLLSDDEQRRHDALFQDQRIDGRNWLAAFRDAQAAGDLEGWSMPELLETVGARGRHEIACHGFSHLPLGEDMVSAATMRHEIAAAGQVAAMRGVALDTFVYPRNLVGRPAILAEHGYRGYRERLTTRTGPVGKALNLLAELDVTARPQSPLPDRHGIAAIPPGHFFNWRLGARRLVPPAVTERRWSAMLARAARDGGVVHLWLHPHNLISAPSTLDVLARVLREVARHRDAGRITVLTQRDYCAQAPSIH